MKKYRIPKLVGIAFLSMVVLVLISFLEVAIYSMIESGHDQAFYEAHARLTAPWISGIFGFIIFFLIVRYWCKKSYDDLWQLAILLPVVYIVLDIVVLALEGSVEWKGFILTFILANGAKFLGSLGAYRLFKPKPE